MQALKDMFKSERGVFALALIAAATTLCALDKMTIDAWREMALYVFGIYVGGKTISGTAAVWASARRNAAPVAAQDGPAAAVITVAPATPAATAAAVTDVPSTATPKSDTAPAA